PSLCGHSTEENLGNQRSRLGSVTSNAGDPHNLNARTPAHTTATTTERRDNGVRTVASALRRGLGESAPAAGFPRQSPAASSRNLWLRRWNRTHSQQRTRPSGRSSTHSQQCALPPIRTLSAASGHPLTTDSVCNYNCVSSTQQIFSCILREAHDDAFGHSGHQRSSSDEESRGREGAPPGIRRSGA